MDSLLFLCACRVVAQHPLPSLHDDFYPVLFQAAFLDGRPLVLRDLVATWPFPELHFQQLVGHRELVLDHDCKLCIEAVIQGVLLKLRQELEEPGSDSSLRVLDMTGVPDSVSNCTLTGLTVWSTTMALADACVEVSKQQQELQRQESKQHKGRSRATRESAALQPLGVDIHADLVVNRLSYLILCSALQTGAAGPLRLKCREFKAEDILASEIMTLLESLDPSCLWRMDLHFIRVELIGLLVILSHVSRFPVLRSLKLQGNKLDVRHTAPESDIGIHLAMQLGMLPSLQELRRTSWLFGNLRPILCFPALKRLDLSSLNVSKGLLEPLRLLLEETSASLLYLDLRECRMADSHLATLLPTLLCCSRLRFLGLYGNPLSTAAIKDLLLKTLELRDLHVLVYPIPVDCHKQDHVDSGFDFVTDKELLAAATAEFSQILVNSGRTDLVWTDNPDSLEALDYFSL